MSNNEERWLPIAGYEGIYEVSDMGRVKRTNPYRHRDGIVKSCPSWQGYLRLMLSKNNKQKNFSVHSLVAAAFIGPRPKGYVINHKDGNKANNQADNLEYVTDAENMRHASLNKLLATGDRNASRAKPERLSRGEKHSACIARARAKKTERIPKPKLTEKQVIEIRARYVAGENSTTFLSREYGVSKGAIYSIVNDKTWKHLSNEKV